MKNKIIKKVTPENQINSLNFSFTRRTVLEDYEIHFHDFYEIEFIISGKCIQYINGEPIECKPNSIIFLTPTDMHSATVIEPIELINLNFDTNHIDSDLRLLCDKSMYCHNISDTFISLLYDEYNSDLEYNLLLQKHLLNCLIAQIVRHAIICDKAINKNIPLEIAKYIQMNYNKSITLDVLSASFGYTPNYLSNQFHKTIGKTIKQFILDTRLDHAAKFLLTTTNSVTDICFASGFTSLSNFLRAFKSKYNQSPNSYRKNPIISNNKF